MLDVFEFYDIVFFLQENDTFIEFLFIIVQFIYMLYHSIASTTFPYN